ncbi:MAG: acyl-CoA dehydrogenase family protein [Gammaproteobacteria bacterium]|nr:acyl-CoA dehydrogenase family protein [Gammaproteobacteria bacterium]
MQQAMEEQMREQSLLERIEALVPVLEAHAGEAEAQRKPVDSVMQAIEETGVYRYFVPKRFGGYEFGMETFMKIGLALGEGCLSTAWVTTFCIEHNWLLALYNQQAQEDIFGRFPYIIAPGTLAPKGTATPVEGGYRVTGRWEWGTGIMHANWALLGALTPVEGSDKPDLCMFAVPIDEVEVIDTWQIAGMAGTGSNDVAVQDVFVPEHRVASVTKMRSGQTDGAEWLQSPLYRMPMMAVLGLTAAAPAVGCARKAVKLFRARLKERMVYGTTTPQGEKPVVQHRLGHIAVAAENAEILLMQLARETEQWGRSGEVCPDAERARLRVRIGDVVRKSRDVVRDIVEASGAHAHFLDNPLQRMLRDVNALSCHTVFDLDISAEQYGRVLVDLPVNMPV